MRTAQAKVVKSSRTMDDVGDRMTVNFRHRLPAPKHPALHKFVRRLPKVMRYCTRFQPNTWRGE